MLYQAAFPPGGRVDGSSRFPTTVWTVILSARNETERESALASLCNMYWFPLYVYVRRMGYAAEEAQDLTQEFFVRVLEKGYLDRADRNKGRFRSFILSCLKSFLQDQSDRRAAIKRGGRHRTLSFDFQEGEGIYVREPANDETPERIFERRWALALLDRAVRRLRNDFAEKGKAEQFEILKPFLQGAHPDVPYSQLAKCLNVSESALKVAIHRLKKSYKRVLIAEITGTVARPEEVEDEIRYLIASLAARATDAGSQRSVVSPG